MKRLLVCASILGRERALHGLVRFVARRQPDGIIFAGGVLACPRKFSAHGSTPWGMTTEDARFLERFFTTLGKTGVFAAIIPGPEDTPLEEFLHMGMRAEMEFPNLHLVHATLVEKENLALCGLGGCFVEESIPEPDYCSRTMAEYYLRPLWTARQPHKVLLLPAPAPGCFGNQEYGDIVNTLINSYHPSLCVVGGGRDGRGAERIAGTLTINPGCLADGQAAFLDWGRPADDQVEFLNLNETQELLEVAGTRTD